MGQPWQKGEELSLLKRTADKEFSLELYAVTDRSWLKGEPLADKVEQAIIGGATMIQLREKVTSTREFINLARSIKQITDQYGVPLIINDRLDIALAIDASGLHVGQDDMPARTARALLGPDKILGVSAATVADAQQAEADGADYIGVGALFPTDTKTDADSVNLAQLKEVITSVKIPVVGIGGINVGNLLALAGTGLHGVAVVSAIFGQRDARGAAQRLKVLTEQLIHKAN